MIYKIIYIIQTAACVNIEFLLDEESQDLSYILQIAPTARQPTLY